MLILFSGLANSVMAVPQKSLGMVVTTQHLATDVGQAILAKGGNAIDAAVAVGYALSVVEPCCGNIGGGGFMLIRLKNSDTVVINFRETAPLKAGKALYFEQGKPDVKRINTGYLSVAVPGTVMGLNTALKRYGRLTLKEVMAPAIKLAEQGFILVPGDVAIISKSWDELKLNAQAAALFSHQGHMLQVGERLIQSDLANTLKQIAAVGTSAFYHGSIAKEMVADSQNHGGIMTLADFEKYQIEIQHPISCDYRGYTILTAPPPSAGGVVLCEMLTILSGYPLAKYGFHQPLSTHYTLEAMRYAYEDRNQLGDPNFVHNPIHELLSVEHAKTIRHHIRPWKAGTSNVHLVNQGSGQEKPQTTHYSILDQEGNAVSVTYTLNGYFGAKIIAGKTGIFLNNEMDDFSLQSNIPNKFGLIQSDKNNIQPRKRPLSSMTPTIVMKDQQVFMILGAPGGSTIPTQVLETVQNVIDYHIGLKMAVDAPRFHMQWLPDLVYLEPQAFSAKTLAALKSMGYHFQLGSPFNTPLWGAVAAILVDQQSGELIGAIDKRRSAGSVGQAGLRSLHS